MLLEYMPYVACEKIIKCLMSVGGLAEREWAAYTPCMHACIHGSHACSVLLWLTAIGLCRHMLLHARWICPGAAPCICMRSKACSLAADGSMGPA